MSGRTVLADALRAGLRNWQVVADARALDVVRKPGACVLWTSRITRDVRNSGVLTEELVLWVLTATDKPTEVHDDLDELLAAVDDVMEPLDAFIWTEAERGVLADKFDGYRLSVTCGYTKNKTEGT